MNTENLHEYAARNKIRFASSKGEISVEHLWDVPLRSRDGFNLDAIAKAANKALKAASEESFVETRRTPANEKLEAALEIVKRVISVKLAEEAAAKKSAENRAERDKLLKILAEKQDGKLSALSEEDIRQRIEKLSQ